ncbi:hypothetical protein M422DRAFT_105786, partial [Sphaerobolus stellatus SS14]
LVSLPEELISSVVSRIDSPQDLLSLALTCKPLCNYIIPDHLHLRRIRSTIWQAALFKELGTRTGLAANVRHL